MKVVMPAPNRFIGLDIHKAYMLAAGVEKDQNEVLSPQRVNWDQFEALMKRTLRPQDEVVIEMTTNTWDVYDALLPHVHSVCVVHPPSVKAVVNPQVMTDKIAARTLAKLLAAKLLVSILVPPAEVRQLRHWWPSITRWRCWAPRPGKDCMPCCTATGSSRKKGSKIFHPDNRPWWESLHLSLAEKACMHTDLDTLAFAQAQKKILEGELGKWAARIHVYPCWCSCRVWVCSSPITLLSAIGDIRLFPGRRSPGRLCRGEASPVHDSGQTRHHRAHHKAREA